MKKYLKLFVDAVRGKEEDFTKGSIDRAIVLLSIPMILEMLMESIFAIVDIYWVSQISLYAAATVGLTESVITIVYSLAFGLSAAATAMVARRIGEKKQDEAAEAGLQSIYIGIALAIIMGIPGFIFAEDILRLMGGEEDLIKEGVAYTQMMFGGNIVIILLFLLNGIFRGAGDASLAMRALLIANTCNLILDPVLIFGWGPFPELGLFGAAVATNIGRGIGVCFQLYCLFGPIGRLQISSKHTALNFGVIKRLLEVTSGGAGQNIIASASWIFLMRIIALFGSVALAGYTIAIRIIIFCILPAWGMANAAATLVGQNLGANQPDRAEQSAWRTAFFGMLFLVTMAISLYFTSASVMGLFTTEEAVIAEGVRCLQIILLGYIAFAYGMVLAQGFNGAGDTRTPTWINFVSFWLMEIPLGYFLAVSLDWGTDGVYWSIAIAETFLAFLAIYLFRQGKWKTTQI